MSYEKHAVIDSHTKFLPPERQCKEAIIRCNSKWPENCSCNAHNNVEEVIELRCRNNVNATLEFFKNVFNDTRYKTSLA